MRVSGSGVAGVGVGVGVAAGAGRAARRAAAAVAPALAALLLLPALGPAVAFAQEAEEPVPPPAPPPAPAVDLGPLVSLVGDSFGRLPERIASAVWEYTGGQALKALAAVVGVLLALARALAGGVFGGVNVFTQIPEPWVTLAALDGMRARLVPLALAVGTLAGALVLLRWVCGLAFGWTFPGWAVALVKLGALAPLVGAAPAAMLAIIRAGNGLAAALFDPSGGLPGLDAVPSGYDHLAAEGIAALLYLAVACWLWWVRVQVVIAALLLFIASPLAVACWVLPFALPQWIARTWATLFVGTVAVQVLQSLTLGTAAALLGANVVAGGAEGAPAGVLNLALAAGLVAATCYVPRRVLGALVAHTPPGLGWLGTGLQAGLMLSGVGWGPGMVGRAAPRLLAQVVSMRTPRSPAAGAAGSAVVNAVPVVAGGRVGSLLAGQRPMLPPPR
jgi:hypothetical protein